MRCFVRAMLGRFRMVRARELQSLNRDHRHRAALLGLSINLLGKGKYSMRPKANCGIKSFPADTRQSSPRSTKGKAGSTKESALFWIIPKRLMSPIGSEMK